MMESVEDGAFKISKQELCMEGKRKSEETFKWRNDVARETF